MAIPQACPYAPTAAETGRRIVHYVPRDSVCSTEYRATDNNVRTPRAQVRAPAATLRTAAASEGGVGQEQKGRPLLAAGCHGRRRLAPASARARCGARAHTRPRAVAWPASAARGRRRRSVCAKLLPKVLNHRIGRDGGTEVGKAYAVCPPLFSTIQRIPKLTPLSPVYEEGCLELDITSE